MPTNTEQKILDAALKIFSKHGYTGARTRIIARESGFTEMTLFRKFETKENLFNRVITANQERIVGDFEKLLPSAQNEDPRAHFHTLVMGLVDLMDKNFEYVNIIIYERERVSHSVTQTFVFYLGDYLKKILPDTDVDLNMLSFSILSFVFFLIFNKKAGKNSFNISINIEEFIKYNSNALNL
jgi:AcrR family transcriptional regulator